MQEEITFKELKDSGYKEKTITEELQANLIARIQSKQNVFEGLWGYEDTVVPQLKKAILAGHHIQSFRTSRSGKNKNCPQHGGPTG